jgi:uncharacterized membrane protein (DUF2068 family)
MTDKSLDDPYRPPESDLTPPIERISGFLTDERESELSDRTRHLPVEATIRTIGLIYILTAVFGFLNVGVMLYSPTFTEMVAQQAAKSGVDPTTFRMIAIVFMIFGAALVLLLGLGLRELKNWARWTIIVFGVIGQLGKLPYLINPVGAIQGFSPSLQTVTSIVGTVIAIVLIFLLFLPGADHVCSKHYRFVISETRELRATLGLRDKILLGAFVVNYILGTVAGFL